MKILKLFRPFAHVYGAMVYLIFNCSLLSLAFGATSFSDILLTALLLTSLIWPIYLFLSTTISAYISFREPGILLMMVVGVIAGTMAITLTGVLLPGSVLLTSIWAAIPYAFAGTLVSWAFALITKSLKKGLTFLPKR
jgi:hypothetical protein